MDHEQLRGVLMDYQDSQVLDNLIRAYNGLPIMQFDFTTVTATVTSKLAGTVSGGQTLTDGTSTTASRMTTSTVAGGSSSSLTSSAGATSSRGLTKAATNSTNGTTSTGSLGGSSSSGSTLGSTLTNTVAGTVGLVSAVTASAVRPFTFSVNPERDNVMGVNIAPVLDNNKVYAAYIRFLKTKNNRPSPNTHFLTSQSGTTTTKSENAAKSDAIHDAKSAVLQDQFEKEVDNDILQALDKEKSPDTVKAAVLKHLGARQDKPIPLDKLIAVAFAERKLDQAEKAMAGKTKNDTDSMEAAINAVTSAKAKLNTAQSNEAAPGTPQNPAGTDALPSALEPAAVKTALVNAAKADRQSLEQKIKTDTKKVHTAEVNGLTTATGPQQDGTTTTTVTTGLDMELDFPQGLQRDSLVRSARKPEAKDVLLGPKKFRGEYYWVPRGFEKALFELSLATVAREDISDLGSGGGGGAKGKPGPKSRNITQLYDLNGNPSGIAVPQ
jgi:hypothetical protein